MKLFFITNNPKVAKYVISNGVDRIFIDLEINGKVERQGNLDTVISRHSISDVGAIRSAVPTIEILVRVNPVHNGLEEEINQVIESGADIIMLPMFHNAEAVRHFIELVDGRAKVSLLIETVGAMESLSEIVKLPGIDEVHIGLNDLHLELKNHFMFEPLADGLVDSMAFKLRDAQIPFGIGGIARVGEGLLPAELLISEHIRLGSSAAILSRTFHRAATSVSDIDSKMNFAEEIDKIRNAVSHAKKMTFEEQIKNQQKVKSRVANIIAGIKKKVVS